MPRIPARSYRRGDKSCRCRPLGSRDMEPRLRALCDLGVALARETGGRHEYDGRVQDLSPTGVRRGLAALGGGPIDDPYDEALVSAKEAEARVFFGELRLHRRNPMPHLENLDVGGYDREYAPAEERAASRRRHLAAWPDAVDGSVSALAAQARLVAHLESAAGTDGEGRDGMLGAAALGAGGLALLLGSAEATEVDLAAMVARADAERDRLRAMLEEACGRLAPGRPVAELVAELLCDHPDADGVLTEAQALTDEVIAWTAERDLAPYSDGTCVVAPAPESRQWATAMMAWAAPGEPDTPSWYWVPPPRPEWPAEDREEWLQIFSRTTLPAITVHEVAPGHFSHGLALRHAPTLPRRVLTSAAFIEGWAHYVEEVAIEEGFRAADARFPIGVAIEALLRVTRLACAIGLHTGAMTVAEAAARFERDAFTPGSGALSEARRGSFDPTYGRYTWGKLAIRDLREQARRQWGEEFGLPRFHAALLEL